MFLREIGEQNIPCTKVRWCPPRCFRSMLLFRAVLLRTARRCCSCQDLSRSRWHLPAVLRQNGVSSWLLEKTCIQLRNQNRHVNMSCDLRFNKSVRKTLLADNFSQFIHLSQAWDRCIYDQKSCVLGQGGGLQRIGVGLIYRYLLEKVFA